MSDQPGRPPETTADAINAVRKPLAEMTQDDFVRLFSEGNPLCRAMGIAFESIGEGEASLSLPWREDLVGDPDTGVIHGGAVSVLLDTACGIAVMVNPGQEAATATIDLRIDYMRPARPGETLHAKAKVYHSTRNVAFLRARAWTTDYDRPVAFAAGAFTASRNPGGAPEAGDAS